MIKLTKKDFNKFKSTFIEWQTKLGLLDYKVAFAFEPLNGVYADIAVNQTGKIAMVRLSSELDDAVVDGLDVEGSAKHEAIHLLLSRLCWLGTARYLNDGEIPEEDERIVRRLEKVL